MIEQYEIHSKGERLNILGFSFSKSKAIADAAENLNTTLEDVRHRIKQGKYTIYSRRIKKCF